MHLVRVRLGGVSPFTKTVECELNERVNLFIGPNASGKSTLLRTMYRQYTNDRRLRYRADKEDREEILSGECSPIIKASPDWPRRNVKHPFDLSLQVDIGLVIEANKRGVVEWSSPTWGNVPLLHVPAIRFSLPVRDLFGPSPDDAEDWPSTPNKSLSDYQFSYYGVFYGDFVRSTINWLRETATGDRGQQARLRNVLEVGYSCAKRICPEVIHDVAPHHFVEEKIETAESPDDPTLYVDVWSERNIEYGMGIGTSDNILGEPLYAGVLSSGTQGTLLWIYALALKIAHHYDWQEGWQNQPAILLIDEIENHLHPTWQRRVIPALLEHFPGLQIFATTHSPFVVAGLKAGQVHLLSRNEQREVTATTNEQDVVGWTADEILRTIMRVPDPTDDATAEAAQELRQLRKDGPAATEAEEQERQERILELRRKVDRDLLAGGPMAAQRELFEQHLAEILEKHRQSQSLNQENG